MWRRVCLFYLLVSGCWADSKDDDGDVLVVETAQGAVRGHRDPESGVFAFYSIPYATAPAGSDKFKAPLPGPAWLEPLDAVDEKIICPQIETIYIGVPTTKKMQDDCLVTSVYVPDTKLKKLPVVVYVHGGAFQISYGDKLPPTNLVKNKNVVAVTFNYRLGVTGFLCLGTKNVPGNAGLKDQVALLRWVNRNIANFGGNPDDVTIIGASAGSVAVELLMLSKTTAGLFHKVIPESGSSVGIVSLQTDPIEKAKNIALQLGCTDIDDVYDLEKFYTDAPLELLLKISKMFSPMYTFFGFTPCVERGTDEETFLDDAPVNILKNGKYKKLPMLFGYDSMEGILKIPNFALWKAKMNENFSKFLPPDLQFDSNAEKEKVARVVKEFYFGDKLIDENTILGFVDYFSDVKVIYPTLLAVKLHAQAGHNQVYLYEYSFVDEDTRAVPYTDIRGANHGDQTAHVNGLKFMKRGEEKVSQEYKEMYQTLQDIWYNFITTGKPVPEGSALPNWPTAGANFSPHMSLAVKLELRGSKMNERYQFWDEIYSKHYKVPVAPPIPPHTHSEL